VNGFILIGKCKIITIINKYFTNGPTRSSLSFVNILLHEYSIDSINTVKLNSYVKHYFMEKLNSLYVFTQKWNEYETL